MVAQIAKNSTEIMRVERCCSSEDFYIEFELYLATWVVLHLKDHLKIDLL